MMKQEKINRNSIFTPFIDKEIKPQKLIELFSSDNETFCDLYFKHLPNEYTLTKDLSKLIKSQSKCISNCDFPDFLRALGAICLNVFIGPKRILFDITYSCNLDCLYCRRHSPINPGDEEKLIPERAHDFFPYDELVQVLDDAQDMMVEEVLLVGGGEPSIHPQFFDIVKAVKVRGFLLSFSTNGLSMTSKLADLIVNEQVDNVTVSVSGVSFESYKKTHPSMSQKGFDRLFNNFEYLHSKRRKYIAEHKVEYSKPFCIFLHVITSDNYHEVIDMALIGQEYGFDTIWYKLVHPSEWSRHLCLNEEQAAQVKEDFKYLKTVAPKLKIKIDDYMDHEIDNLEPSGDWSGYFHDEKRCFVGWNFSYVDLSTDYSFCCGDRIIGQSKSYDNYKQFWTSDEYKKVRKCGRDINYGEKNIVGYNGVSLIDDFCKSCDNTNFNEEMEDLIHDYGLSKFL
ncbi:MAG: radical SAM protein [Candidatus Cloacimonetes bacterium]|nr:radical SAM protein [Candidatus Cloacimonadota bacterium]